jgi:Kef-type K+ transport system membrane component KefB
MLLAGLELRPKDLFQDLDRSAAVAAGGMLFPLALGLGLGWWILPESDLRFSQMMFIGVALAITAVPVAVKALMDVNALDSRVGRTIVASAVIDDILSLILLAVFTAVLETGSAPGATDFLRIGGASLLFLAIAFAVGHYAFEWLGRQARRLKLEHLEFTFVLVSGLALAVLAELLGLHFILGAFAAGLFFRSETMTADAFDSVLEKVNAVNTGFLAPIFFASIGMHLDLSAVVETPWVVLAILVAATIGKLLGAGVPARLSGASLRESAAIGIGMNARGAVELIIAGIALDAGLFLQPEPIPPVIENLFSAVVITAIVTTLTTGLLLKRFMASDRTRTAN